MFNEFKGLGNLQRKVDELSKFRDVFNKSVAGRILEADVDNMITNALRVLPRIHKGQPPIEPVLGLQYESPENQCAKNQHRKKLQKFDAAHK